VTATVANASDVGISDLTASLADFAPDFGMTLMSDQTIDIPLLNGLEKMDLEWDLHFSGSLFLESIPICLTLSSDTNDVFTPAPFVALVSVMDTLDTDADGMPDSYEGANDLNAAVKDMDGDDDGDDLINLSEYMLGTDPQDPDTDGDGFTDGDEVNRGSDPLDPEQTPDTVIPSVHAPLGMYTAEAGGEFTLPVTLGDLWDNDVYSADIRLAYNPNVLAARGASNGEIAADQNWSINSDIKADGQIWIAMAGVTPLSSGGLLVNVEFDVIGSPGDSSSVRFLELTLNEGDPTAWAEDGILWVYDKSDVESEGLHLPDKFTLFQNFPNPFNPVTTIGYTIPSGGGSQPVQLEVFNLNGEKIRTLVNQRQTAGYYRVQWHGRNDLGRPVPSGIYVYRLQVGAFVQVRKMMYLK